MAILSTVNTIAGYANSFGYALKTDLVTKAGYIVKGSSDGTTGGMDGVDRIVSGAALNSQYSWIVLETPHATISSRVQILFTRTSTSTTLRMIYAPEADFTGGTATTLPTSAYSMYADGDNTFAIGSGTLSYHFLCNNEAPYGFAAFSFNKNTLTSNSIYYLCPISNTPSTGKPYVAGNNSSLSSANASNLNTYRPCCQRTALRAPSRVFFCNLLTSYSSSSAVQVIPSQLASDNNGRDVSIPLIWANLDGYYFGTSDFISFDGTIRPPLSTFNNRTRFSVFEFSFPWDGTTVPMP